MERMSPQLKNDLSLAQTTLASLEEQVKNLQAQSTEGSCKAGEFRGQSEQLRLEQKTEEADATAALADQWEATSQQVSFAFSGAGVV